MKVSLAQINPTLGDFQFNSQQILTRIQEAHEEGSDLVVFPECCLFGYYPADLLERKSIVKEQLKYIDVIKKKMPKGIAALIGFIGLNTDRRGKRFRNSAALISTHKIHKVFHKQLLPTYDIFDESRHFESGDMNKNFVSFKGKKILVTLCEDIWAWETQQRALYSKNPLLSLQSKCDLIINLSASPYTLTKSKQRKLIVEKTCKSLKAPMIYVNQVGAQDETIFDGGSLVANKNGQIIKQLSVFKEDLFSIELSQITNTKKVSVKSGSIEDALILGIKDFFKKTGFTKAHLGLSGGIDSAVVYVLACKALGPANVTAIFMPTKFNAKLSEDLSLKLCKNMGQTLLQFPIDDIFGTFSKHLDEHLNLNSFGLVHENLQARIRGNILMAYSNQFGSMLLSTGNKTEMAVGYTTLYGDMCGGLSPIADLTKTQVYKLARDMNAAQEVIPDEIITRAPSAELRENQKDQDSLPEYAVLDKSVTKIVEHCLKPTTPTDKWTLNALMKSEFKRWQAPPILKVTGHSFGRGRRFPIAHKAFY